MPRQTRSRFLRSKLRRPIPSRHFVRRERLLDLLDELVDHPITMVTAPPGAGKSALLADWLSRTPMRHAWVTLGEADADPAQLWAVLTAALEQLEPEAVQRVVPLFRGAAPLETAVVALLDELHSVEAPPTALVIDNVHVLDTSRATLDSFAELAENLAPWLHLVLSGRRRPVLPVDRMLANGALAEIRFPELRLTVGEALEVMVRLAPRLPGDRLRAAVARADGWPAALQLAALAARTRQAIPVVHADGPEGERLIDEYVWREVLRAESPDVVAVLLDTAVAERLSPGLAEALTGRPDAFDLLLEAEERGLFVTRLEHGGWLQLHTPVRKVMVAEAERRSPERARHQHRRAAQWFEGFGEFPTALDHWLAADDPKEALRLLASSATELYDNGRQATIQTMLQRIPPRAAGAEPTTLMQYAFPQLVTGGTGFLDTVATLRQVLDQDAEIDRLTAQRGQVLIAQAALMTGDWIEAERATREVVAAAGPAAMLDPFLRFGWNVIARSVALTERWDEQGHEVTETRSRLSDPERLAEWEGTRALGLALSGRPTDAILVAAGVRRAADVANMIVLRAEIDAAEALAHFEVGAPEAAERQVFRLRSQPVRTVAYTQVLASLIDVDRGLLLGDLHGAQTAFDGAQTLIHELMPGSPGQGWVARRGTRVALAQGDLELAQLWSRRDPDPFWRHVSLARVLLAQGRRRAAAEEVGAARPRCTRHDVVQGLVRAQALDDREAAVKTVGAAIELAAEAGLLVTVAAEGDKVLELAEVAAWRVPQAWMDRLRRAALPSVEAESAPMQVEPLTPREQEVLRLLPSRLTLREVADELSVTMNTLKFHLRVIYRKLGVNSRAGAVEVARWTRGPHQG